jgi:hypothetical protein
MDEEHLGDAGNLHGNNDVELYQRDFLANVDYLCEFDVVLDDNGTGRRVL